MIKYFSFATATFQLFAEMPKNSEFESGLTGNLLPNYYFSFYKQSLDTI